MRSTLLVLLIIIGFVACRPDTYVPKPRGYYRIPLPERTYQTFDNPSFPYTFRYPVYGKITVDTNLGGQKPENPYWINVDFPSLGGTLYLSYKVIDATHPFYKLLDDAHELSYTAHGKKADYINTPSFNNGHNVRGVFYTVGGNTATRYQFFATDSVKNYLRGALYFNVSPNVDSLQPVNDFLRVDMDTMIQSLRWR